MSTSITHLPPILSSRGNPPNPRVLVTYAWVRSSCALIRNLARHGLEVHAGDHQAVFMSRYSRYCSGWFQYPHFHENPDGFLQSLVDYIEKHDIGVYIPSHEEGFVVARHRDRFPDSVHLALGDYEAIHTLDHKLRAQQLADRLGIPHPQTIAIQNLEELDQRMPDLPIKGVIKAPYSHGSHGVAFYEGRTELREKWITTNDRRRKSDPPPVVQEFLNGQIQTVMVLAEKGEVKASFARRNIREKESFGGAAVKCESIRFPSALEDASRMVKHLGYSGVAMFEFLVDPTTDHYWLMEVNPRYWGTTPHDLNCGIDYPFYQYCLAHDIPFERNPDYPIGHKARWIAGDVISFFKKKRRGHFFADLKKHLDFDDDSFMDFHLDDPLPFFVQSYLYFKYRREIFADR